MTKYSENFRSSEAEARYFAAYDEALKLWPVQYESKEVDTSFGSTHMLVSGRDDAPPIIFLHGFSAIATEWYGNIPGISGMYRCYALEIPGDVNKSVLTKPFGNRDGCVSWLSEVMSLLHIDKAAVVGRSYGGWFALNFALLNPDRVNNVILLSPANTFVPLKKEFYIRALATQLIHQRSVTESFSNWTGAKGYKANKERITLLFEGRRSFNFTRNFTHIIQPRIFTDNELKSIKPPVLLMLGDQEHLYNPKNAAERARKLIKNIRVEVINDAGHSLNMEQKNKVNQLILEFLPAPINVGYNGM